MEKKITFKTHFINPTIAQILLEYSSNIDNL